MTVISKLSDRDGLIYEAIKIILINEGSMKWQQLQYELLKCGMFVNGNLLQQAISVMKSKGLVSKNEKDSEKNTKENTEEGAGKPAIQLFPSGTKA